MRAFKNLYSVCHGAGPPAVLLLSWAPRLSSPGGGSVLEEEKEEV